MREGDTNPTKNRACKKYGCWRSGCYATWRADSRTPHKKYCSSLCVNALRAAARDYQFDDGKGCIGIIASVTEPFCGTCNRFRLTADGQVRNCLFGSDSGDVRTLLRSGGNDASIAKLMIDAVAAKKRGHGTDDLSFGHTSRPMYSIGG